MIGESADIGCSWARVSLGIIGDERLDPCEVSRLLNLAPSMAFAKGDPLAVVDGVEHVQPNGCWVVSSPEELGPRLECHLRWLLDRIEPVMDRLLSELAEMEHELTLNLAWQTVSGSGLAAISRETAERLLRLGADVYIDFYCGHPCHLHSDKSVGAAALTSDERRD